MRKEYVAPFLLLFFVFLFLYLLCPLTTSAQRAYGWKLTATEKNKAIGPCSFDVERPQELMVFREHSFRICAGAFCGNKYYAYSYRSQEDGAIPLAFGSYDFDTGDFTPIADYAQMPYLFYDMSYDYARNRMYALGLKDDKSILLSVDLSSGAVVPLVTLSDRYLTLAVSKEGIIYAENLYGELTTIDPLSGAETVIGGGDYFPTTDVQSFTFDHLSGRLYWILPTERSGTEWVEITNNMTNLKQASYQRQFFYF